MRNQRGIALVLILVSIAVIITLGGSFYLLTSGGSNSFIRKGTNLTESQKKELEQAKSGLEQFASIIESAQGIGLNSDEMNSVIDSAMEVQRNQILQEAKGILSKNTCDVLMSDIEQALKLAGDSWLAGDEKVGEDLWEWAREAFRGYVVDAALAVGATFLEQDDVDLYAMSYEERKTLYAQAREKFYDRAILAQQAQLFGFEDIHTEILNGDFLEPVCVQLWDITLEIEYYKADDTQSTMQHWVVRGDLKDIPIYNYHPRMGLPVVSKSASQKGNLDIVKMWWKEAADSIRVYHSTKKSDPWWTINVSYKDNTEDFWQDEIIIEAKADSYGSDKPKAVVCDDYFGCSDLIDPVTNGTIKMNIPALRLWQRKPFSYEGEGNDLDKVFNERVTYQAGFYPTKRVKVSDFKASL